MKVLYLFNEIKYSGAELMYANAASLFQSYNIELLAFSTGKSLGEFAPEFERNNIKTYHRPIKPGVIFSLKTLRYYLHFYYFLKNEKIDVLHIHRNDLYLVALCSWLCGIRTIKTQHSVFKNRKHTYPFGYLKRIIARKVLMVTFQTIGKSVYENELHYYYNPSIRINNWYDSSRFFPLKNNQEKQSIREKLGLQQNTFIMISVGGCNDNKNHFDIIRALAILDKKINYQYLHLGRGTTEIDEKKLANELGIADRVQFLGNIKNVRDYLVASDVFIMSSKFEGLGNACLEAMACGLPSILYNSPGLRDLINHDDNGFLIEHNFEILAEKITEYFKNPEIIKIKGQASINFVNKVHSKETNVLKIISLYDKES